LVRIPDVIYLLFGIQKWIMREVSTSIKEFTPTEINKALDKLTKKGIPITVIGLPYAGKTTLVNWLREKRFTRPKPTVGFDFDQIQVGDVFFNIFDISGQKSYRASMWKSYVMTSVGIIFVLDSTNSAEIDEALKWFWVMIDDWLESVFSDKVILFIANKSLPYIPLASSIRQRKGGFLIK